MHWYLRPVPGPFSDDPIFVAFIGCGTTSNAAGVFTWPCDKPPIVDDPIAGFPWELCKAFPPPGDELFDEFDRNTPAAPYIAIWFWPLWWWSKRPSSRRWPAIINKWENIPLNFCSLTRFAYFRAEILQLRDWWLVSTFRLYEFNNINVDERNYVKPNRFRMTRIDFHFFFLCTKWIAISHWLDIWSSCWAHEKCRFCCFESNIQFESQIMIKTLW